MHYIISFLEGIITFISPCLFPLIPIYISYFAGSDTNSTKTKTILNAVSFVLGFTLVFVMLGTFAGTIGKFLKDYESTLNIISGSIITILGLKTLGFIKLPFLKSQAIKIKSLNPFMSFLFGLIFSISWTPCIGVFLGSALLLASTQGSVLQGTLMLLSYSIGLGIPFIFSAILIDKLKSTFDFINKNKSKIEKFSGIILIIVGILIISGLMSRFIRFFSI